MERKVGDKGNWRERKQRKCELSHARPQSSKDHASSKGDDNHRTSRNEKNSLRTMRPKNRAPFSYERAKDLPSLIPLWPSEIKDESQEGREKIILKLNAALRAERRRGRAGHWAYDLNRHRALKQALDAEMIKAKHS